MKIKIYKLSLKATIFSAVFGSLITLLYQVTKHESLLVIGFLYLIPTIIIHFILCISVLLTLLFRSEHRTFGLQTLFLMLMNIPLAKLCAHITLS